MIVKWGHGKDSDFTLQSEVCPRFLSRETASYGLLFFLFKIEAQLMYNIICYQLTTVIHNF